MVTLRATSGPELSSAFILSETLAREDCRVRAGAIGKIDNKSLTNLHNGSSWSLTDRLVCKARFGASVIWKHAPYQSQCKYASVQHTRVVETYDKRKIPVPIYHLVVQNPYLTRLRRAVFRLHYALEETGVEWSTQTMQEITSNTRELGKFHRSLIPLPAACLFIHISSTTPADFSASKHALSTAQHLQQLRKSYTSGSAITSHILDT